MRRTYQWLLLIAVLLINNSSYSAEIDVSEIFCTIREASNNLICQWVNKNERKAMSSDEIVQFIDRAEVAAYVNVRSRKGLERSFLIDADSPQFRKLLAIKKAGSISEISKAKNDLFSEIERKLIKISDDLDAQLSSMELVKYDNYVAVEKYKYELRKYDQSNQTFQQGPAVFTSSALSANKYEVYLGFGSTSSKLDFNGSSATTVPTVVDLTGRMNWSDKYASELEYRNTLSSDYTAIGSYTKGTGLIQAFLELKNMYCFWGGICAELNVANITYLGITASNKIGTFQDTFVGLGARYVGTYDLYKYFVRASYGQPFGTMGSSMGSFKVNYEHVTDIEFGVERNIIGAHGVAINFDFQTIYAGLSGSGPYVVNANQFMTLAYKYSW